MVEQVLDIYALFGNTSAKNFAEYIPSICNPADLFTFWKVALAIQGSNLKIHINIVMSTMIQEHMYPHAWPNVGQHTSMDLKYGFEVEYKIEYCHK